MQWLRPAAVPRAHVGSRRDQGPDESGSIARGRDVQRAVAHVEVVADLTEIERLGLLACRAARRLGPRERGRRREHAFHARCVVGDHRLHEAQERRLVDDRHDTSERLGGR
jgi:hypothetical protein